MNENRDPAYVSVAVIIFALVAFTFLFPCNFLIPLDRRTVAVVGALACYLTRAYLFPSHHFDLLRAVDFNVLILLASIMVINHIVIHLKETKKMVKYCQNMINTSPTKGFWMVSALAFATSPFLTNDGVCLLLVEPILLAFQNVSDNDRPVETVEEEKSDNPEKEILEKLDIIYFLLGLACSTNIGSTLTYTGNPQNMIVASDSIAVMPSYKFLIYMIFPALFSWIATMKCIEWCWKDAKIKQQAVQRWGVSQEPVDEERNPIMINSMKMKIVIPVANKEISLCDCFEEESSPVKGSMKSPLSPRRQRIREREKFVKKVVRVVSSPIPYCILGILSLMIILIFVNVMPIAGLICLTAIVMVLFLVVGNRWKDSMIWEEESTHSRISLQRGHRRHRTLSRTASRTQHSLQLEAHQLDAVHKTATTNEEGKSEPEIITYEDHIDNLNEFFEDLFNSIDYSLLLIFLGTFIVIENMASTGIPKTIFQALVGKVPFSNLSSIVGVSLFVLVASQLLGNVAVVQLAKPNIHELNDDDKRFAWAMISFVSTVGGNLTIAGSAANIIVAEKANRMDATINFDFFRHFRVCFAITVFCCVVGGAILAIIVKVDNYFGSQW